MTSPLPSIPVWLSGCRQLYLYTMWDSETASAEAGATVSEGADSDSVGSQKGGPCDHTSSTALHPRAQRGAVGCLCRLRHDAFEVLPADGAVEVHTTLGEVIDVKEPGGLCACPLS